MRGPYGRVDPADLADCDVHFTSDPAHLREADFHIVAAPTPIDDTRKPDLRALLGAARTVACSSTPATSWCSSRPSIRG